MSCLSITFVDRSGELLDSSLSGRSNCFSHNRTVSGVVFSFIAFQPSIGEICVANGQLLVFLIQEFIQNQERSECARQNWYLVATAALRNGFDRFRPTKIKHPSEVKSFVLQIINSTDTSDRELRNLIRNSSFKSRAKECELGSRVDKRMAYKKIRRILKLHHADPI